MKKLFIPIIVLLTACGATTFASSEPTTTTIKKQYTIFTYQSMFALNSCLYAMATLPNIKYLYDINLAWGKCSEAAIEVAYNNHRYNTTEFLPVQKELEYVAGKMYMMQYDIRLRDQCRKDIEAKIPTIIQYVEKYKTKNFVIQSRL